MNQIEHALEQVNEVDIRLESVTRILARARPDQVGPLDADAMLEGADALLDDAKQLLSKLIESLNEQKWQGWESDGKTVVVDPSPTTDEGSTVDIPL